MKFYARIAIVFLVIVIDEATPAIPLFTELKGTLQRVLDHADRIHNQKKNHYINIFHVVIYLKIQILLHYPFYS